jgi:hypothetical protein
MRTLLVAALIGASALGGTAFAQRGPNLANLFPDPNGDGVTTKEEMLAAAEQRFNAADTNKDGKLSAEERAAAGPGFGGRGPNAPQGDLTLAEFKAAAEARFDRMDTNHDGKIDAAERAAVLERFQNMRPGAGGPPPAASGNMPPPPSNQ